MSQICGARSSRLVRTSGMARPSRTGRISPHQTTASFKASKACRLTDVMGSLKFLDTIERRVPNPPMFRTVADCGAGIGRVSREVLTQRFQTIDLVEPCANLLESAQKTLNPAATAPCRVERFLQMGVQDFNPEIGRYDVIWNQWCLLYLTDEDLVAYLKRCKAALAPKVRRVVLSHNRIAGVVPADRPAALKNGFVCY
ncbi:Alpha N-terminal protein methyltransferase 1B [Perkinsus olseni]|uniref:Alpha N-terminal protein methyltransferase 1 n=1 Tax=Perkinsus olseni TaxID=32597 RepID=A0A7J6SHU7_PEROL|nr:Alpha N-terminal protein methyltransferase 1B [Perkinsus olseni]